MHKIMNYARATLTGAVLMGLLGLVSACGQKGPLTKPTPTQPSQHAAVDSAKADSADHH